MRPATFGGQEAFLNGNRFTIGILTVVFLVALRVAIGWHFFTQGLDHYNDPKWSSEGFLRQAKGPWAEFYHKQVPDFHGFEELIARPYREKNGAPGPKKAVEAKNARAADVKEEPKAVSRNIRGIEHVLAQVAGDAEKNSADKDKQEPLNTDESPEKAPADAPKRELPDEGNPKGEPKQEPAKAEQKAAEKLPTEGDPQPPEKSPAAKKTEEEKLKVEEATKIYTAFASRVEADWKKLRHGYERHYQFDDQQKSQSFGVLEKYNTALSNYLASIEDDLRLYQRELLRLEAMETFKGAEAIPYESKRLTDKRKEVADQPSAWLADLRGLERGLHAELNAIATDKQRETFGSFSEPEHPLRQKDQILTWTMLIFGACLIVGLLTRISALACAVFLGMVMASQPPWVSGAITALFPYQLAEFLALLVIATTAVGRWAGLDFFVHFLITAPFRRRPR